MPLPIPAINLARYQPILAKLNQRGGWGQRANQFVVVRDIERRSFERLRNILAKVTTEMGYGTFPIDMRKPIRFAALKCYHNLQEIPSRFSHWHSAQHPEDPISVEALREIDLLDFHIIKGLQLAMTQRPDFDEVYEGVIRRTETVTTGEANPVKRGFSLLGRVFDGLQRRRLEVRAARLVLEDQLIRHKEDFKQGLTFVETRGFFLKPYGEDHPPAARRDERKLWAALDPINFATALELVLRIQSRSIMESAQVIQTNSAQTAILRSATYNWHQRALQYLREDLEQALSAEGSADNSAS